MKNRHKYFRNQSYEITLKNNYNKNPYLYNYFVVITKTPITNQPIELDRQGNIIGHDWNYNQTHNRYEYYGPIIKPNVPYTIIKLNYRNKYKTYLKKYRNKQFRHSNKNFISSNKSNYKKLREFWWGID